jgi:hypothetical protein
MTTVRIKARNADSDLADIMIKRVVPDGVTKIKSSKIYGDKEDTFQIFNDKGELSTGIKFQGDSSTISSKFRTVRAKSVSSCDLFINQDICESNGDCVFNVIRMMFSLNGRCFYRR